MLFLRLYLINAVNIVDYPFFLNSPFDFAIRTIIKFHSDIRIIYVTFQIEWSHLVDTELRPGCAS